MSELISRDALLESINNSLAAAAEGLQRNPDDQEWQDIQEGLEDFKVRVEQMPAIKPSVVANISGGVLQGASSDYPIDIYALDFDLDVVDEGATGIEIDGEGQAYLSQQSTLVDPEFVQRVIDAPEINLFD